MTSVTACCILCGFSSSVYLRYQPKSHFYDSEVSYKYFYCTACDVLWLDRSTDISQNQYDEQYYSFRFQPNLLSLIKIFLKRLYFDCFFHLGLEISFFKEYVLHRVFRRLRINKQASIIDIGCGSGRFIGMMKGFGYSNSVGIDPYAKSEFNDNFIISNINISEVRGKFDVVNAHHVLEHTDSPLEFMFHVQRILNDDGVAIITFPRLSSLVEYSGSYSYLLQAPDHLTLLSDKCFRNIAANVGLEIVYSEYDGSGTFQWLVMSSLWQKGVNIKHFDKACCDYFTANELKHISSVAKNINRSSAANAIYVMKKIVQKIE